MAAPDLAGLAAQLGQALAALEDWEARHTTWDERFKCRIWSLHTGYLPIMRLHPPAAALKFQRDDINVLRGKLTRLYENRLNRVYEEGFAAGRAARQGDPLPARDAVSETAAENYPRLRRLD